MPGKMVQLRDDLVNTADIRPPQQQLRSQRIQRSPLAPAALDKRGR
jgi:hypothetical protein